MADAWECRCGATGPRPRGRGLCGACYMYQRRWGRPRPLTFPTHCVVCGQPLNLRLPRGPVCGRCQMRGRRRGLSTAAVRALGPAAIYSDGELYG